MTFGDLFLGLLVATGFFVSAFVSPMFRNRRTGVLIGGVTGLALSVAVLAYGLTNVFAIGGAAAGN